MKTACSSCWLSLLLAGCLVFAGRAQNFSATTMPVGHDGNELVTPDNQIVAPAGKQVELPGVRPNALALSPNGKRLVTSGMIHKLLVVDPRTGIILQKVPFPADQARPEKPVASTILSPDERAQLSFTGLQFSPDGRRIYMANVNGDIKVFNVAKDGSVSPRVSLPLPPANAPQRAAEIPAGIAVSRDGRKIYVAGNLSNRLLELDAKTGKFLRTWAVGVAPYDVVLAGHKAYVSNWGGRRPDADSRTGPAGRGTRVRVDARSIASEGSVSIIDLRSHSNQAMREIVLGRHACALALSPNGRWLVAASAGDDLLSVIDTRSDKVVETFSARQKPGDPFGAQPNALAFDPTGKKLYCANGTQNAVAVFRFRPQDHATTMLGLIPVGWFPGALAYDAHLKKLCVANLKNIIRHPEKARHGLTAFGFNTKQYAGSLSLVSLPSKHELARDTRKALADLRYPLLARAKLPPRAGRPPVPVPERVGEPSVFKHVIYIIKENRTYDQVLGDVREGNGDASLCNFGERVTPNEHKIVRDFVLLDNTYCSGILSADGHQWTDTGIATDYVEREFAGWPRSYPAGGSYGSRDALAYSPAGFIWNDALAHGKTVADFGEFTTAKVHWKNPDHKGKINFAAVWQDYTNHSHAIAYTCEPDIASMKPYIMTNTIGWDLAVPDVWRAARFIDSLKRFEKADNLPNLIIIWLPNDHTSGTRTGSPTPAAQVADNDLAVGRVVDAVSHSKYWKDTCIFAVEDDPQDGWDHVSGYRTTAYVVSAYTKRHAVIHTQYNQTSLLRTMELILGLPPMNQMDATATPMFACFTNTPDFAPFNAVPNQVPLNQMNPAPHHIKDAERRHDAYVSNRLPLSKPDQCNETVLNHILWRATMGKQPYPAWAIKAVDDDD